METNDIYITGSIPPEDGYYQVNDGKKILYFQDGEWFKAEKDQQKKYGSWISKLEKQPKVKSYKLFSC